MKVLMLSPTDLKGGASKVAYFLAQGLQEKGVDAQLHVSEKVARDDWVHPFPEYAEEKHGIKQRLMHRLGVNCLSLTSPFPKCLGREYFEPFDLIHLHDLPRGFNLNHLKWLSGIKPLVWTIHSMAPFTGNCIFAFDCERWKSTCGKCPQFGKWPLLWYHRDGSRLVLKAKKHIYRKARPQLVGVSDWVTGQIRESAAFAGLDAVTVQNPVDLENFFPLPKAEARQQLKIPENAFVVMFAVSGNPLDSRKGIDIIQEALSAFKPGELYLLPTGIAGADSRLEELLSDYPGHPPTFLNSSEELRRYYNAADVVWHPSRADTSSMVGLEATACGTPVIAADVGGVGEIVRDKINGILIQPDSPDQLVQATQKLMDSNSLRQELSKGGIKTSAAHSIETFTEAYIKCYQKVV